MIARSFKSVIWVATVGGAALCCYMVSLRVATERADLAKVEHQIIAAKREIRSLQTELGTRGRMSQLEDWNANVLALSAPSAAQFVHDDMTLARLERRDPTVADRTAAEVRMASAETGAATAQPAAPAAEAPKPHVVTAIAPPPPPAPPVVHQASYSALPKAPAPAEAKKPKKVEAAAKAAKPAKLERQAKAAKPEAAVKPAAKPERQAKAPAKPEQHAKAAAKPEQHAAASTAKAAPAAKAKPAAPKLATPASAGKKLAHAKTPARPGAQQSDAD